MRAECLLRELYAIGCGGSRQPEHVAMVAIHAVYYNFARIPRTLRTTPAMAAGLSDHVWSLEEIALLA